VSLKAGYTEPLRTGDGSAIRGELAGLDDHLADGWSRKMVRVASGDGSGSDEMGCCLRGDKFVYEVRGDVLA